MSTPPKSSSSKRTREVREKKPTAAQLASEANRRQQMAINANGRRPGDRGSLTAPKE